MLSMSETLTELKAETGDNPPSAGDRRPALMMAGEKRRDTHVEIHCKASAAGRAGLRFI